MERIQVKFWGLMANTRQGCNWNPGLLDTKASGQAPYPMWREKCWHQIRGKHLHFVRRQAAEARFKRWQKARPAQHHDTQDRRKEGRGCTAGRGNADSSLRARYDVLHVSAQFSPRSRRKPHCFPQNTCENKARNSPGSHNRPVAELDCVSRHRHSESYTNAPHYPGGPALQNS